MDSRSAGHLMACNDFIPTACVLKMTWGGGNLKRYNLDVCGEMAATGHMVRIWEEDDSVLSTD
jgi:hypothetical protein